MLITGGFSMQRICILIYAPKNLRISKIKRETTTTTAARKQAKVDEREKNELKKRKIIKRNKRELTRMGTCRGV